MPLFPWKEKYLDYEIETHVVEAGRTNPGKPWKEKYLDYEIETRYSPRVRKI